MDISKNISFFVHKNYSESSKIIHLNVWFGRCRFLKPDLHFGQSCLRWLLCESTCALQQIILPKSLGAF